MMLINGCEITLQFLLHMYGSVLEKPDFFVKSSATYFKLSVVSCSQIWSNLASLGVWLVGSALEEVQPTRSPRFVRPSLQAA